MLSLSQLRYLQEEEYAYYEELKDFENSEEKKE